MKIPSKRLCEVLRISNLIGQGLDQEVAKCEGVDRQDYYETHNDVYMPSTDWAQGGPIIQREKIKLWVSHTGDVGWCAAIKSNMLTPSLSGASIIFSDFSLGPTPLVAAMRCYVASKLGEEEVSDGPA